MKKDHSRFMSSFARLLFYIIILVVLGLVVMRIGDFFNWSWGEFWLNFISNAGSSAVIGYILYWIITRPDEKKATTWRRRQALAMLKTEFIVNFDRANLYSKALKSPTTDLTKLYPLRFTRGAWNALRESGFLPQFDDVKFVYEVLRVNEVITVANASLTNLRKSKTDNKKIKAKAYGQKAIRECNQIITYLEPILAKLSAMDLPHVEKTQIDIDNINYAEDATNEADD